MKISKLASASIITAAIILLLYFGKDLIIPFILAIIFWFIIKEVRNGLRKIPKLNNILPTWVQSLISTLLIFGVMSVIVKLVAMNIETMMDSMPNYEKNVEVILNQINKKFNIDVLAQLREFFKGFDFSGVVKTVVSSITDLFGNAITVIIYVVFILIEEKVFKQKIDAIYADKTSHANAVNMLEKIDQSISNYLILKTFTSLTTGVLSYIAFLFIGIDAPVFWAFLIFLLNYIPNIGSLIATLFPAVFALLQFGEALPFVLIIGIVGFIQFLVGNAIEPKLMGNSLNLSPLVVILSLMVWGAVWGVTGMVLSVPITVIMTMIFAEFQSTRFIAVLLSEKGDLKMKE